MPMGYEFGFRKKPDVVATSPDDWEETHFDIRDFIRSVNELKRTTPVLQCEGVTEALWGLDGPVLCLRKREAGETLLVIINKDWHRRHRVDLSAVEETVGGNGSTILWPPGERRTVGSTFGYDLAPCEIVLIHHAPPGAGRR